MNKNKDSWFTLVELVIAIILSSIIFLFLMNFVSKTIEEMSYSKNKTKIITQIYDFEEVVDGIREKYNSWNILVNNETWTWSDILLFRTWSWETKKEWYIFAMISENSLKIDWTWNVDNIWDKVFAYKKVSDYELNLLSTDINNVYDFKFNRDKIFENIKLKDFQLEKYNSWSLFEAKFFINPLYKKNQDWIKYSEIWTDKIEKINLIF